MLIYKEKELILKEPTMKEYRLILEYIHATTGEIKIKDRYNKLLSLVANIYTNQITTHELQKAVESNQITFSDEVGLGELLTGSGISEFLVLGDSLVSKRLDDVVSSTKSYYPMFKTSNNKSKTGRDDNQKIEIIRYQLSEWYKSVVITGQIMTWVELDSMTVSDFEAFKDTITAGTSKQKHEVEVTYNPDLLSELGVQVF